MLTRRQLLALPALLKAGCSAALELPEVTEPTTTGPDMATFHYGGTIPTPWPPRNIAHESVPSNPGSSLPPAVPYLATAPDYSINVDTGHQYFVDDFLVGSSTAVTRAYHGALPVEENPVMVPDADEGTLAMPFSDGIWPTFPGSKQLQVFYVSGEGARYTKRALSDDYGRTWHSRRVVVDHGEYPGSGVTMRDSASVLFDPNNVRPWVLAHTKRFDDTTYVMSVRRSQDGLHWSDVLVSTPVGVIDRTTMVYNPFREKWVYSIRHQNDASRRYRRYYEVSDVTSSAELASMNDANYNVIWDNAHWDWPGALPTLYDATYKYNVSEAPQLYNRDMTAEVWGPQGRSLLSLFVAWDTIFYGNSVVLNRPKYNEPVIGFSRDGFHVDRRHGVFPFGRDGAGGGQWCWDWGNKQSTGGPFIDLGNGKWRHFCSGRTGVVGASGNDDHGVMGFGAFDFRADGFASMSFGTGGELTTRTLTHASTRNVLYVNADVPTSGNLRVEVQRSNGTVAAGCSLADCAPIRGDNTAYKVTFDARRIAQPDIPDTFKLRFVGDGGARLYSFWTASENDRGTTT